MQTMLDFRLQDRRRRDQRRLRRLAVALELTLRCLKKLEHLVRQIDELLQVGWRRSIAELVQSRRHDPAPSCRRLYSRPASQNLGLSGLLVQYINGAESIHLRYCTH